MPRKLVKQYENGSQSVKVYRDSDSDEFVVRFYNNGKLHEPADYFTDDLDDAVGTAKAALNLNTPPRMRNPSRRVKSHLLHDISESASGIARDVALLKNPARRIGVREAREMGRRAGFNAASWVDLPEIGTTARTEEGKIQIHNANDQWDYVQSAAYDSEMNSRDYSPFEFTAHAFNESRNSNALWSAYDDGVSKGIAENIRQRKAAMRGIPRRRKNPSRRITRAVSGKHRVEWSTNGKEWTAVHGLKNLDRATAIAAAKQIHKGAPSRYVRVMP